MLSRALGALGVLVLCTVCSAAAQAASDAEEPGGEIVIQLGGDWPQGTFSSFSDPGFAGQIRAVPELPTVKGLMPWVGAHFSYFSDGKRLVEVSTTNFIILATESRSQYVGALQIGLQLGSPSKEAFLRPHAGVAPAFFVVGRDLSYTAPGDTIAFESSNTILGRWGWTAVAGVSVYPTRSFGIALDFTYHHIWNIDNKTNGQFAGFALGVSIPLISRPTIDPDDEVDWGGDGS